MMNSGFNLLVLIHRIDVFNVDECENLVKTIGLFETIEMARDFRKVLLNVVSHGDALVIISGTAGTDTVAHDVIVVVDGEKSSGKSKLYES